LIPFFVQGLILGATAAAQPGPFQAFLLSLIAREGWRRALPAAFAPLLSDGPIILLVLLVLTRLPDSFLFGLQIVGGIFLLYLAWGAWHSLRRGPAVDVVEAPAPQGSRNANVAKAALMNMLSPSPYIFWATVSGPILIEAWRQAPLYGLGFLLSFYVALIGGLMLFIVIFGGASRIGPQVNWALGILSVVGLAGFGLYQLAAGLGSLRAALV
jgi:threonine/homoserine/homoserine lactone efflux protein